MIILMKIVLIYRFIVWFKRDGIVLIIILIFYTYLLYLEDLIIIQNKGNPIVKLFSTMYDTGWSINNNV